MEMKEYKRDTQETVEGKCLKKNAPRRLGKLWESPSLYFLEALNKAPFPYILTFLKLARRLGKVWEDPFLYMFTFLGAPKRLGKVIKGT